MSTRTSTPADAAPGELESGTGTPLDPVWAGNASRATRLHRVWHSLATHPVRSGIVAAVLVAGVVCGFVFTGGSSSAAAGVQTTTSLSTVATGTVRQSVSTTGTFSPADTEDVSFGSAAEITSVKVAQGDTVTKGEVLGTIATVSLKQTLAQARATLAAARSTLSDAQDSSDSTATQLAADKASVASAESAVIDAGAALTGATLVSPIAGTVAEVNVATGDESSGSGSGSGSTGTGSTGTGSTGSGTTGSGTTGSGTTGTSGSTTGTSSTSGDFVIVGGKSWTVSASVDDAQVGLIAKGDQVQITTDNVTGTVFGTVSSVAVLSSGSSSSASYPVTVAVTGAPSGLHDGASATASIIYKQVTGVLTVPSTAVHTDGTAGYVYLDSNGTKTKRTVTTGISASGTTQITSGLTAGQQVYVTTITRTAGTGNSTGTGTGTGRTGGYPGTGTGGFPGGGTGGFPGGGTGGFGGGGR